MLETVHYMLGFIIAMKQVIYGTILSAARGSGERCKLPLWGLERKSNFMHFGLKIWHLVAGIFHFPSLFQTKYFALTFPWPLKFPDFFQLSVTCRKPGANAVQLCRCLDFTLCNSARPAAENLGQVVYSHCLPGFSAPRNWGTKGSFRCLCGYGD